MMGTVKVCAGDLDRTIRESVLDHIDYKFRSSGGNHSISEVIQQELPKVQQLVEEYYASIGEVDIELTAEALEELYEQFMM